MTHENPCADTHPNCPVTGPVASQVLDLDDDSPLTCQYQHPSLHEDEPCEACQ